MAEDHIQNTEQEIEHAPENEPKKKPSSLRLIITIVVALGILYYYLRNQEWAEVKDAFSKADMTLAVSARLFPLLLWWAVESWVNVRLIDWFHKRVSFMDVFWARGAFYFFTLVNVNVALGGFVYYLWRKSGMAMRKFTGLWLFRLSISAWVWIALVTILAAVYLTRETEPLHRYIMPAIGIALLIGWVWFFLGYTYWLKGWNWGPLQKLLNRESLVWEIFAKAKPIHWIKIAAYFLPQALINMVGYYLSAVAFGLKIPFLEFALLSPVVFLIQGLPITFGQFGTTTIAWQEVFPHAADEATFGAFTLFLPFITILIKGVIGLVSMRQALSEWDILKLKKPMSAD